MAALNRPASQAARSLAGPEASDPIHAATDITGYGLLGHALEVARGSGLSLKIDASAVPLLEGAEWAATKGFLTRGETVNFDYLGGQVQFEAGVSAVQRSLLLDPQTSGGLLFFVDPEHCDDLVSALRSAGTAAADVIGEASTGTPGIAVHP